MVVYMHGGSYVWLGAQSARCLWVEIIVSLLMLILDKTVFVSET